MVVPYASTQQPTMESTIVTVVGKFGTTLRKPLQDPKGNRFADSGEDSGLAREEQ